MRPRVRSTREPGELILDVAAGTGTSSASLSRTGARVIAADFSAGMIEVGRQRQAGNPFIEFVQADATALPFADDEFDAVTISFGLRNIVDPKAALAEFRRVTKPGGRVVICEFSRPPAARRAQRATSRTCATVCLCSYVLRARTPWHTNT